MAVNHYDLLGAARRYPAATAGERFTLLVLASYLGLHDGEWSAWPGTSTLATDTLQTERTIKRHLAAFADAGLITTRRRASTGGRGSLTSEIVLDADALLCPGTKVTSCPDGPTTKVTSEPDQGDTRDTTNVTSEASAPITEELEEQPEERRLSEATRLCDLLADLVAENGSKRPNVTDTWLAAADRLMRLDGKTPGQVERMIRWTQADRFWRANIMSMPKLREQYDRLRLTAKRELDQSRAPGGRKADTTLTQMGDLHFDDEGNLL